MDTTDSALDTLSQTPSLTPASPPSVSSPIAAQSPTTASGDSAKKRPSEAKSSDSAQSPPTDNGNHSPDSEERKKKKYRYNAWALKCHEKKREALNGGKIRKFSYVVSLVDYWTKLLYCSSPNPHIFSQAHTRLAVFVLLFVVVEYIVLEDLTRSFQKPSILDLKIGIQQHSVDDPPEKIASKKLKCEKTTTSTLGLRFCGSQVLLVAHVAALYMYVWMYVS